MKPEAASPALERAQRGCRAIIGTAPNYALAWAGGQIGNAGGNAGLER